MTGNSGNNRLTGLGGDDRLDGRGGADTLTGGAGDDSLLGGEGQDTFVFRAGDGHDRIGDFAAGASSEVLRIEGHAAAASVTDTAEGVLVTLSASDSVLLEGLTTADLAPGDLLFADGAPPPPPPPLDGIVGTAGNDDMSGTSSNDTLRGLGGDDTLDGGSGSDRLIGGTGDDVYFVDSGGDVTVEAADEGFDTTHAPIDWVLADNVEQLFLRTGAWLDGAGNALDNVMTGNSGNNRLTGLGGDDRLDGRGGADTLTGGAGDDSLLGGEGQDTFVFRAGDGHDRIGDFAAGASSEVLRIEGHAAAASVTDTAEGVLVTLSASDSVLLEGLTTADLAPGDLLFA